MLKMFFAVGWCLAAFPAVAGKSFDNMDEMEAYYLAEAKKDAEKMIQDFQGLDKPKYQKAYDDYLKDLKIIARTGTAPDNLELYKDLEAMNSNDPFVYPKKKKRKRYY